MRASVEPSPADIENALHGHGPCGTVSRWLFSHRRVLEQVYRLYEIAVQKNIANTDNSTDGGDMATVDELPDMLYPKSDAELRLLRALLQNMNMNMAMLWAVDSLAMMATTGLKIHRPTKEAAELLIRTDLTVDGADANLPFSTVLIEIPEGIRERYQLSLNEDDLRILRELPPNVVKGFGYPSVEDLSKTFHPRFIILREAVQRNSRSFIVSAFAGEWFRTNMTAAKIAVDVGGALQTFNENYALSFSPIPVLGARAFVEAGVTLETSFKDALAAQPKERNNVPLSANEVSEIGDIYRLAINSMLSLTMLDYENKTLPPPKITRRMTRRLDIEAVKRAIPAELVLDQTIFIGAPSAEETSGGSSGSGQSGRDVRPHWRRGHWRRVAVGEGRTGREYRFIKPVFVNVKKLTDEGYTLKDTTVEIKHGG